MVVAVHTQRRVVHIESAAHSVGHTGTAQRVVQAADASEELEDGVLR